MAGLGFRWRWAAVLGIALAAGISVAILAVYFPPLLVALAALTIKGVAPFAFLATLPLSAAAMILGSIAAATFGSITAAASLLLSGAFNLFVAASARLRNLSEAKSPEAVTLVEDNTDYHDVSATPYADLNKGSFSGGSAGEEPGRDVTTDNMPSSDGEGNTDDNDLDYSGYYPDDSIVDDDLNLKVDARENNNMLDNLFSSAQTLTSPANVTVKTHKDEVDERSKIPQNKKPDRGCCGFILSIFSSPKKRQTSNTEPDGPSYSR